MSTAHNRQAKGSLFFRFNEGRVAGGRLGFPLDTTKFFCIGEDQVHVLGETSTTADTQSINCN
jgi:hypothetical protein